MACKTVLELEEKEKEERKGDGGRGKFRSGVYLGVMDSLKGGHGVAPFRFRKLVALLVLPDLFKHSQVFPPKMSYTPVIVCCPQSNDPITGPARLVIESVLHTPYG